jgi:hypothetical protein
MDAGVASQVPVGEPMEQEATEPTAEPTPAPTEQAAEEESQPEAETPEATDDEGAAEGEAEEEETAEAEEGESTDVMVEVFNGGNVRQTPGGEPVLDQINAFEQVELMAKTPDSVWYQIRNQRDVVGWVHYTLLQQDELAQVADQVPVEEP